MVRNIKNATEGLCLVDVHTHLEFLPNEDLAHRLHLTLLEEQEPLPLEETPAVLEKALSQADVDDAYVDIAQNVLSILLAAKTMVASLSPEQTISLPIIGTAHTPYKQIAPYQPQPENINDGKFYIQVEPRYVAATQALNTFSHFFVLSYLDKSLEPETTVRPPWKPSPPKQGYMVLWT